MLSIKDLLPKRNIDIHKGNRGRLLVAGGSNHYPGAPALSSLAALRTGSGIVTLLSNQFTCCACASRIPEIVYHTENDISKWTDFIFSKENNSDAIIAGMGLERSNEAQKFIVKIWNEWDKKILIDGDGLFALAEYQDYLNSRNDAIITPHEAEAARLLKITPQEVHKNREYTVTKLAEKFGCAVLKGHNTLIKSFDSDIIKIINGGAELAVPGSGDVLSGIIGAFLAYGRKPLEAAFLGVKIHGMTGDYLRNSHGIDGILASDIANTIQKVINRIRNE